MQLKRFSVHHLILTFLIPVLQSVGNTAVASTPYFQQEVRYTIHVRLDDTLHMLRGDWQMTYINNSNNPLGEIRIHLWPNAYSSNTTALAKQMLREGDTQMYYMKPENPAGKIDSLTFSSAGKVLKTLLHKEHPDICSLMLDTPLEPGDSITISSPFRVTIPPGAFHD